MVVLLFHSSLDIVWYQLFSFCQRETLLYFEKLEKQTFFKKGFSWFSPAAGLHRPPGWRSILWKRSSDLCGSSPASDILKAEITATYFFLSPWVPKPSADLQWWEPAKSLKEGLGPSSCLWSCSRLFLDYPPFVSWLFNPYLAVKI